MLFDSPGFGRFLGDVGKVVIGPILLAPAIGSLGGRDLWRLLGRILGQVPRRVGIAVVQMGMPVGALVASDVAYALHTRDGIDDASVEVQRPPAESEGQVVQGSLPTTYGTCTSSPDSNPGFKRSAHSAVDDGTSPAEIAMELEPGAPDVHWVVRVVGGQSVGYSQVDRPIDPRLSAAAGTEYWCSCADSRRSATLCA